MNKKVARQRRARSTRARIAKQATVSRIVVNRTPMHTYAQLISSDSATVIAQASTVEKDLRANLKHGGNVDAAKAVGKLLAERIKAANFEGPVAFDRSGFKYHGRVKALADAMREENIQF